MLYRIVSACFQDIEETDKIALDVNVRMINRISDS